MKISCNVCDKYRKFKNLKATFLLLTVSVVMNIKKYLKTNQLKY